mgnify:CR=1 FL=1
MTDFSNLRAVVFDMDGLLIDSEAVALRAFEETLTELGQAPIERETYYRCIGTTGKRTREIIRSAVDAAFPFEEFMARWDSRYQHATLDQPVPLKPGVKRVLDTLQAAGLVLAVATATRAARADHKLRMTGIRHGFVALVGGDQIEQGKPAPDIYLEAARRIGIPPRECLALEDSENGVRAAHAAGMRVVQVPDLVPPSADLAALGHTVMDSLDAVAEAFRRVGS